MTGEGAHIEGQEGQPTTAQTPSQFDAPFAVSISFPEAVTIKMVDATALDDYETLIFFSAFFFSAFVGFVIAAMQAQKATPWVVMSLILLAAASGSFWWALRKRSTMKARSKEFKIKTSGIEEVKAASSSSAKTP